MKKTTLSGFLYFSSLALALAGPVVFADPVQRVRILVLELHKQDMKQIKPRMQTPIL